MCWRRLNVVDDNSRSEQTHFSCKRWLCSDNPKKITKKNRIHKCDEYMNISEPRDGRWVRYDGNSWRCDRQIIVSAEFCVFEIARFTLIRQQTSSNYGTECRFNLFKLLVLDETSIYRMKKSFNQKL